MNLKNLQKVSELNKRLTYIKDEVAQIQIAANAVAAGNESIFSFNVKDEVIEAKKRKERLAKESEEDPGMNSGGKPSRKESVDYFANLIGASVITRDPADNDYHHMIADESSETLMLGFLAVLLKDRLGKIDKIEKQLNGYGILTKGE